ncbi:MAG: RHS repeat domain-containing protein, partial [Bacteroidota bacterium]
MLKCHCTIVVSLLLLLSSLSAWAQFQKPEVILPSPNAASLGTYGEMKVSPFTGVPNIDVPIYTLQENDIKLPISLSYHASGFRPDQHPGWTGLNWSLNAGGAITREVKDLPDEHNCPNTAIDYGEHVFISMAKAGYYFNRSLPGGRDITDATNWSDPQVVKTRNTLYDTEPDKFNFSFLGRYNGTFYLSEKGTWEVQSEQNIKVVFDNTNFLDLPPALQTSQTFHYLANCLRGGDMLRSFGGFTLITEDGTQYIFGGTQQNKSTTAIEYSTSFYLQVSEHWVANNWNLTKIKSPDGREINFTYEPDSYIASMYVSFLWQRMRMYKGSEPYPCVGDMILSYFNGNEQRVNWINPGFASYQGSLIRPVYLASITSTNEQVLFSRDVSNELRYDNSIFIKNSELIHDIFNKNETTLACHFTSQQGEEKDVEWPFLFGAYKTTDKNVLLNNTLIWKKLNSIQIKSKQDPLNGFQYDLNYNNLATERLVLNSVVKKAINGSVLVPAYEFQYYKPANISFPAYLAESADHWGFFNGNTTKYVTLPRTETFTHDATPLLNNLENLRKPAANMDIATLGLLRFIKYPTGGTSEFLYEQHDYSQGLNEERIGLVSYPTNPRTGGLRIKKIISSPADASSPSHSKEYFYRSSYTPGATGLASSGILGGQTKYYWEGMKMISVDYDVVDKVVKQILSAQNVLPLSSNSQGLHVGYSEVVEKLEDGSYTIYKFTNFDTPDGGSHYDTPALPGSYEDVSPYNPYCDKSFERGLLIAQEAYTATGKPVQKLKVSYQTLSSKRVRALFYENSIFNCPVSDGFRTYLAFPYYQYTYKYRPSKEETYLYDQNDQTKFVTSTTTYPTYNADGQRTEVTTSQSNGASVSTTYKYPSDYNATAMGGLMTQLQTRNMLNRVIEERVNKNNQAIKGTVNEYNSDGQLVKEYLLETLLPLASGLTFNPAQINPNATYYKQRTSYSYDPTTKNLSSQQLLGDAITSYAWGYNQTLPIAEVKNASNTTQIIIENIPSTGSETVTLTPTRLGKTFDFQVDYAGPVIVKSGLSDSPSQSTYIQYSLDSGTSSQTMLTKGVPQDKICTYDEVLYQTVNPGPHQLQLTLRANSDGQAGVCATLFWPKYEIKTTTLVVKEFFYDGFEEATSNVITDAEHAHAGIKYRSGDFTPAFTLPNTRKYIIEYWYLNDVNAKWQYLKKDYTTGMQLTEGNFIDEVRIYPVDAQMTTYTYDPLVGVTSSTDAANVTTYYEYDAFLRLKSIRDQDGNIVKNYVYHYKDQKERKEVPSTSLIPTAGTPGSYTNQLQVSGPKLPDYYVYYTYKDQQYNKLYVIGRHIQVINFNNLTNGLPTSTLYSDMFFTKIQKLENQIYTKGNKIYFGTHQDGIYVIDRASGASQKLDPLAGENVSYPSVNIESVTVDNVNQLMYVPVNYRSGSQNIFYGLLEWNLSNSTKRWINSTSSPVSIPVVPAVEGDLYWSGYKLHLDQESNTLYLSGTFGLWWWNRSTNATGVYNTEGGLPLVAGNQNLPSNLVTQIYIDKKENKFYIGTHSGVFVWNRNDNTSRIYNSSNSLMMDNLVNHIDKY